MHISPMRKGPCGVAQRSEVGPMKTVLPPKPNGPTEVTRPAASSVAPMRAAYVGGISMPTHGMLGPELYFALHTRSSSAKM